MARVALDGTCQRWWYQRAHGVFNVCKEWVTLPIHPKCSQPVTQLLVSKQEIHLSWASVSEFLVCYRC